MKQKTPKPSKQVAKDARKAVMLLQRAEEIIKDARDGNKLEYRNYLGEAEDLSAKKVWVSTGAASIASISAAIQSDVLWTEVELLLMMGVPIASAIGLYNLSSFSHILSPWKTRKAKGKQDIENKLHRLCRREREQKEEATLQTLAPLLQEVNIVLQESNTGIAYEPQWGKFSVKKTEAETSPLHTEPTAKPLPKWESIYILARKGNSKDLAGSHSLPRIDFTPALMKKEYLNVEEAIAVLRHTETVLKAEIEKTSDPNDYGRRNPANPEYVKKESRLLAKAQPALDVINRALQRDQGKIVYIAGTRHPNFNISNGTGLPVMGKWQVMEQLIAENLSRKRVTALDSLQALELPSKPKTPA